MAPIAWVLWRRATALAVHTRRGFSIELTCPHWYFKWREGERRPQSNLSGRYNRGVKRYSYRGEDEARDPIFRSDLEERPEPPSYEPLRPEGGLWSVVKRLLAPLVALGLLLVKFKWILLALLKVKFMGT